MLRDLALKQNNSLSTDLDLSEAGQVANGIASRGVFVDFRARKAYNTLRRYDANLATFTDFLRSTGVNVGDLTNDPEAWRGMSWGLVAGFQRWLLAEGYAVGTVNIMVSTVKIFAKLAFRAGVLGAADYALINSIEGYSHKERGKVDEKRERASIPTRRSPKKAEAVHITDLQSETLKNLSGVDGFMFCLFLDYGLRIGELAALTVDDFDLAAGVFRVNRVKVGKVQTFRLVNGSLRAARAILPTVDGRIFPPARTIAYRVRSLGAAVGLAGLSPHDCRHYAATKDGARLSLRSLMDKYGWSSPAMAARYMASAEVIEP